MALKVGTMMKLLSLLFIAVSGPVLALELKVGDILLQPLQCSSCTLIEEQEETIYSHMGIVLETHPVVKVAEALGSVRSISFQSFDSRTQKGQKLGVYRLRDQRTINFLNVNKERFAQFFDTHFNGLQYDKDFLWDNIDENGQEKHYCSELITKLLKDFTNVEVPTKPMKYDKNREFWIKYFNGNPPDGLPGNSPGDFEKSELFMKVGEL